MNAGMMQRARTPRPRAGLKNPAGIDPDDSQRWHQVKQAHAASRVARHRDNVFGSSHFTRVERILGLVSYYAATSVPQAGLVLAQQPRLKSSFPYLHESHPCYEPVKRRSTREQADSPMNLAPQNCPPREALIDWLAGRWGMKPEILTNAKLFHQSRTERLEFILICLVSVAPGAARERNTTPQVVEYLFSL